MARSARGLDWLNKFPTQEQLDNLDPPPPLQMDPAEEESTQDTQQKEDDSSK